MLWKFVVRRLAQIDPLMKLTPIMKLTGRLTVSLIRRFIFLLFELFWIPIINNKNKERLNVIVKNIFFKGINILNN